MNISQTVVHYTTQVLENFGLKQIKGIQSVGGFDIYPAEYFAPIDFITKRIHITEKLVLYIDIWLHGVNEKVKQ